MVLHAGNFSDYRARVLSGERARSRPPKGSKPKAPRSEKPPAARKLAFAERRELEGLIDRIDQAEGAAREIGESLADPETYRRRGDDVARLRADLARAQARVAELTARWEALEEKKAALEPGSGF